MDETEVETSIRHSRCVERVKGGEGKRGCVEEVGVRN